MSKQRRVSVSRFCCTIKLNSSVALLLVLFLGLSGAHGQVLYGSLTGNVTDPNDAAINGATVEALNVNTGAVQKTQTEAGIYRFFALLPGNYTITVSNSGFKKFVRENVPVAANSVVRVDAQLALGAATETVNVSAETPLLQTDKADVHTDLSSQQIETLPDMSIAGTKFPVAAAYHPRRRIDGGDQLAVRKPAAGDQCQCERAVQSEHQHPY